MFATSSAQRGRSSSSIGSSSGISKTRRQRRQIHSRLTHKASASVSLPVIGVVLAWEAIELVRCILLMEGTCAIRSLTVAALWLIVSVASRRTEPRPSGERPCNTATLAPSREHTTANRRRSGPRILKSGPEWRPKLHCRDLAFRMLQRQSPPATLGADLIARRCKSFRVGSAACETAYKRGRNSSKSPPAETSLRLIGPKYFGGVTGGISPLYGPTNEPARRGRASAAWSRRS